MSINEKLFKQKVTTFFKRLDVDGSGSIEQDDLSKWADKLVSFGNVSDENEAKLRVTMNRLWSEYFEPADVDQSGSISCQEISEHIRKTLGDDSKRDIFRTLLPLIFDAIDSDKSGCVSKEEFANYFKSLNIDDQQTADHVFDAMDVNSDKTLSKDEFVQFGGNFFTCDESDPARLFFGPLVD